MIAQSKIVVISIVVLCLVLFIYVSRRDKDDDFVNSGNASYLKGNGHRNNNIRKDIITTSYRAYKANATSPLHTVYETTQQNGMEFIINFAEELSSYRANGKKFTLFSAGLNKAVPSSKPDGTYWDPFAPTNLDPTLVVREYASGHVLILNKFHTLPDHVLLITKTFQSQFTPLTSSDFSVLYDNVVDVPAIGFLNYGFEAGASQAHKHMQLIPFDVFRDMRSEEANAALPIDDIIVDALSTQQQQQRGQQSPPLGIAFPGLYPSVPPPQPFQLRPYANFRHGFVLLMGKRQYEATATVGIKSTAFDNSGSYSYGSGDSRGNGDSGGLEQGPLPVSPLPDYGAYLRSCYLGLLQYTGAILDPAVLAPSYTTSQVASGGGGIGGGGGSGSIPNPLPLAPHNLLLTPAYMGVIPRCSREARGVDVNAMGYIGSLLLRQSKFNPYDNDYSSPSLNNKLNTNGITNGNTNTNNGAVPPLPLPLHDAIEALESIGPITVLEEAACRI